MMFYKMIENARDRWYASTECTIKSMTDYIESKGMLRDAQINAIKTYLFLKISCESRPLADLFSEVNLIHLIWKMWKYRILSADIWSKIQPLQHCLSIPV